MNTRPRVTMRLATVGAVSLMAVLTIACQRQSSSKVAEAASDVGSAATPAQSASVDTPPGAPAGQVAEDTTKRGQADTSGRAAGEKQGGAGQASGQVANGWKQYEANCSRCHGQDALGSAIAPDLRQSVKRLGQGEFMQVVKNGRTDKGMPGFASQLDDKQISDIHAYVVARGSGQLKPGRPQS